MLICATLRTTISTGTKNRAFGLLQFKANSNPKRIQFQRLKMLPRLTINGREVVDNEM